VKYKYVNFGTGKSLLSTAARGVFRVRVVGVCVAAVLVFMHGTTKKIKKIKLGCINLTSGQISNWSNQVDLYEERALILSKMGDHQQVPHTDQIKSCSRRTQTKSNLSPAVVTHRSNQIFV
jgi:hypothetical protein